MQQLGLTGTLWPIILVDAATQLPLTVIIFSTFFAALPVEIEETAFVDGLGRIAVLARIVAPIATLFAFVDPGLAEDADCGALIAGAR